MKTDRHVQSPNFLAMRRQVDWTTILHPNRFFLRNINFQRDLISFKVTRTLRKWHGLRQGHLKVIGLNKKFYLPKENAPVKQK